MPAFALNTVSKKLETRKTRTSVIALHLSGEWFSSGEDELLGVVLLAPGQVAGSYDEVRSAFDDVASFWGADPVKQSAYSLSRVPNMIERKHFAPGTQFRRCPLGPGHPKAGVVVDLALFEPVPCRDAQSWRVEVPLRNPSGVSRPMVRLALVRYQPYALPGLEMSEIVIADYMQLSDDREVVVVRDPKNRRRVLVTVYGNSHDEGAVGGASRPEMRCWLERRCVKDRRREAAWVVDDGDVFVLERTVHEGRHCWHGSLTATEPLRSGSYRIAVEELEMYPLDSQRGQAGLTTYFDLIPVG